MTGKHLKPSRIRRAARYAARCGGTADEEPLLNPWTTRLKHVWGAEDYAGQWRAEYLRECAIIERERGSEPSETQQGLIPIPDGYAEN